MAIRTEFAEATGALKTELLKAASAAVHQFEQRTGVTPSDIHLTMAEITTLGDSTRRYAVTEVTVDFNL